jgi:alpha-tubulin suppressor-like RCC1 family protein
LCDGLTYCVSGACKQPVIPAVLSAGSRHTCFIKPGGQLYCWGANSYGQVGTGNMDPANAPFAVPSISTAVQVAAGDGHTCVLKVDNTMWCWGQDDNGQCGQGVKGTVRLTPVLVQGLPAKTITQIQAGIYNTYVLMSDGSIYAWGTNIAGNLGVGTTPAFSYTPVLVSQNNLSKAVLIASAYTHVCAVNWTGDLYCWGAGSHGEIGNGGISSAFTPAKVLTLGMVVGVDVGYQHSCAILKDGTTWCWGYNKNGLLAIGNANDPAPAPAKVTSAPAPSILAVGGYHSCVVKPDGTLACWGDNGDGQGGTGTPGATLTTATAAQISGVATASSGGFHTCARKGDGTLWCWGENDQGQLGLGNFASPVATPSKVTIP